MILETSFLYFVVASDYEVNQVKQRSSRHTITLNHHTFDRLKSMGHFGESYTELLSRLLDHLEKINGREETAN
jgi:hypothetical protein